MPIQRADYLAVRTRHLLEPLRHRQPFVVVAEKPRTIRPAASVNRTEPARKCSPAY
jgi:hypothetical protein